MAAGDMSQAEFVRDPATNRIVGFKYYGEEVRLSPADQLLSDAEVAELNELLLDGGRAPFDFRTNYVAGTLGIQVKAAGWSMKANGVPTDGTDASPALNAMLLTVNLFGGAAIIFDGDFTFLSGVLARDNVQIEGRPGNRWFNGTANGAGIEALVWSKTTAEVNISYFNITKVNFDGGVVTPTPAFPAAGGAGVWLWRPFRCRVDDNKFVRMGGAGVIFGETNDGSELTTYMASYSTASHNYMKGVGLHWTAETSGKGIRIDGKDYCRTDHNVIIGATAQAIQTVESFYGGAMGNLVVDCEGGGIWVSYGSGGYNVTNNIALRCGRAGFCVPAEDTIDRVDYPADLGLITVSNNISVGDKGVFSDYGFYMCLGRTICTGNIAAKHGRGYGYSTRPGPLTGIVATGVVIGGNQSYDMLQQHIYVEITNDSRAVDVEDLTIRDMICDGNDSGSAILVVSPREGFSFKRTRVTNNKVRNAAGRSIDLLGYFTEGVTVEDNDLHSATTGFGIRVSDNGYESPIDIKGLRNNKFSGVITEPYTLVNATVSGEPIHLGSFTWGNRPNSAVYPAGTKFESTDVGPGRIEWYTVGGPTWEVKAPATIYLDRSISVGTNSTSAQVVTSSPVPAGLLVGKNWRATVGLGKTGTTAGDSIGLLRFGLSDTAGALGTTLASAAATGLAAASVSGGVVNEWLSLSNTTARKLGNGSTLGSFQGSLVGAGDPDALITGIPNMSTTPLFLTTQVTMGGTGTDSPQVTSIRIEVLP